LVAGRHAESQAADRSVRYDTAKKKLLDHPHTLARDIAAVVDYRKTGIDPVKDERRHELKAPRYPNFMEKETRRYTRRKVLGKMYRQACCAFDLQTELEYLDEKHSIELDQNLLIDGFERYLVDGQRHYHLYCNKFSISTITEAELITGCQSLLIDEKRSYDAADVKQLRTDTRRQLQKASAWLLCRLYRRERRR
jgi:hypothetical protein